jgi:hypothetical protein
MLAERALYFFIIVLLTLVGLIWGLIDTRRIIEAPFLYATGMAIILCPQLYVAASGAIQVPDEAYRVFCIMVILCTVAFYAGYFQTPAGRGRKRRFEKRRVLDHKRLYLLGLICSAAGMVGQYELSRLGTITDWRGWPVYWLNLLAFLLPGIILMLVAYLHAPRLWRLVPPLILLYVPLTWVFDSGRRQAALTLPLVLVMPFLIYRRNLRVPRWAIVAGLLAAFVVVYAFPQWRKSFDQHDYLQTIRDNPPSTLIDAMLHGNKGDPLEITDGMIVTGARYELGNYEYGKSLYNQLIQNWVPGTLIGYGLKNSLFIGQGIGQEWVSEVYNIPVASYTAKSGYEDLFSQFSFFGCIVMYLIGRGFRKVYESAVRDWDVRAIIFLCFFISFPAGIAYGSIAMVVALSIPEIALMLVAFRLCVKVKTVQSLRPPLSRRRAFPDSSVAGLAVKGV